MTEGAVEDGVACAAARDCSLVSGAWAATRPLALGITRTGVTKEAMGRAEDGWEPLRCGRGSFSSDCAGRERSWGWDGGVGRTVGCSARCCGDWLRGVTCEGWEG